MKGKYRGCDIEVKRGGAEFLTFAVFDDGYEVTSGFTNGKSIHLIWIMRYFQMGRLKK